MSADIKPVNVRAAIRAGKDATAGWPGHAMSRVSYQLRDAETRYLDLLWAAQAMSRVHLAKGNDMGRAKQIALREAIARATEQGHE